MIKKSKTWLMAGKCIKQVLIPNSTYPTPKVNKTFMTPRSNSQTSLLSDRMTKEPMIWRWRNEPWWILLPKSMISWESFKSSQRTQNCMSISSSNTKRLVEWGQRSRRCFKSRDSKRFREISRSRKKTKIGNSDMFNGWNSRRDLLLMEESISLNSQNMGSSNNKLHNNSSSKTWDSEDLLQSKSNRRCSTCQLQTILVKPKLPNHGQC